MSSGFPSVSILGGRVDDLPLAEILAYTRDKIARGEFLQIVTVNSLMLLDSEKDPELREIIREAELCVADSSGVVLAATLRGSPAPPRIPGVDLIYHLAGLAQKEGWPVYLIGSQAGVAEKAGERLQKLYPGLMIAGARHGYFSEGEEMEILKDLSSRKSKILLVGLGHPRQEKWIRLHKNELKGMLAMGVGGSFDVISGTVPRAPVWMQRAGLEWLFRLAREPWRAGRIVRLPVFLLKALSKPRHLS